MISGKFGAMFLAAVALAHSSVRADSVTLPAVADTGLSEFSPTLNAGTDAAFKIGTLGSNGNATKNRGLIRFDPLASIPSGATITSVQFTIDVYKTPNDTPFNFDLRNMFTAWTETNATWQVRNGANNFWGAPGGLEGTDFSSSASASLGIGTTGPNTFVSTPNLVADVQGWLDAPASNFGWMLLTTFEGTERSARRIYSREFGSHQPTLVVTYTTVPEPAANLLLGLSGAGWILWRIRRNP